MKHLRNPIFILTAIVLVTGCSNPPMEHREKKMADGRLWSEKELNVELPESYCYDDDVANCEKYGRLYTWEAARNVCREIGEGWRLPTDEEWHTLVSQYGGIVEDSKIEVNEAYDALRPEGASGFNVMLGGGREVGQGYNRIEAHGFYWTSTAITDSTAWFYNFGKGKKIVNHHEGEKGRAFLVRCVKDPS